MIGASLITLLVIPIIVEAAHAPLILPLVASQKEILTKVTLLYGDNTQRQPTEHIAVFHISCDGDDGNHWTFGDRTDSFVWSFSGNRPNIVTSIPNVSLDSEWRRLNKDIYFCMSSPILPDTHFAKLMEKFETKVVSFWMDTAIPYEINDNNYNRIVGEMVIGGSNPARYVPGTTKSIRLKTLSALNTIQDEWVANSYSKMSIGGQPAPETVHLSINTVGEWSSVSGAVYDLIFGAVGPADDGVFDCRDADKIKSVDIDQLHIDSKMLYIQRHDGSCLITIEKVGFHYDFQLFVGNDILRHFHFAVSFDAEQGDFAHFSTRKDANYPATFQQNSKKRPISQSQNIEQSQKKTALNPGTSRFKTDTVEPSVDESRNIHPISVPK